MTIGARIKAEREAQGITRTMLAQLSGVKYPTLAGIENGDQESSTQLHAIAAALGVSPTWLESGRGRKSIQEPTAEYGWSEVKGFAQAVGLGSGAEAQEYAETHQLKFRAESLARKQLRAADLAVMYGHGDSMEPRIRRGDAILFDQSDTRPTDGALYVIIVPGAGASEYNVKRCEIIDDMVFFKADNPNGDHTWRKPRRMDNKRHPITIVGRVRWIGSWE